MASPSRIVELSNIISTNTSKLDTYLQSQNHHLSFEETAPTTPLPENTPPEYEKLRVDLLEATRELQQLVGGVDELLSPPAETTTLSAISKFKIASYVPLNGEISFTDLAEKCNLNEHDLRRIIRFAIVHYRIFKEPRKGIVAHSAASRRLAESEMMKFIVGLRVDEVWPALSRTVDAMVKFPRSQEPNASGFALANNTDQPFYEYLRNYPDRAKRFSAVMSSAGTAGLQALVDNFPWSALPSGSTIIDLGGSQGHVSAFVAEAIPSLNFIVQDLPEVISDVDATYKIPNSLTERVKLMDHSFFTEQPVKNIDIVLIRYIFHNWSDEYCIRILRNLIPGLKKGSRFVIQDHLLPEPGSIPLAKERSLREMDLLMLTLFNSRERDVDDWKELVEKADPRFKLESAKQQAPESPSGIMIVSWEADMDGSRV